MYKNNLDYILENQKVGGYWVHIEWENSLTKWCIWVDNDEKLESIIAKENANGKKVKEIKKEL